MSKGRGFVRLLKDNEGSTAVEFALVALLFIGMLFAGISASRLGYSAASLHFASEAAARCRAMGTTCSDPSTTQTYALGRFHNIAGQTPSFVSDTPSCGNRVTGTLNYSFGWVLGSQIVPLSSTACFPS